MIKFVQRVKRFRFKIRAYCQPELYSETLSQQPRAERVTQWEYLHNMYKGLGLSLSRVSMNTHTHGKSKRKTEQNMRFLWFQDLNNICMFLAPKQMRKNRAECSRCRGDHATHAGWRGEQKRLKVKAKIISLNLPPGCWHRDLLEKFFHDKSKALLSRLSSKGVRKWTWLSKEQPLLSVSRFPAPLVLRDESLLRKA